MKIPHWPVYTGPNKDITNTILRTKYILSKLNNPHLQLKNVIHITGTKGKGSTALYISNILRASGYKVNTYTSPHIYECNERILLNGIKVSDEELYEATETVRLICESDNQTKINDKIIEPSMFEALTCSAFDIMAKHESDFNVIEVGMGAINDATNVFDDNPPLVCVFTPIHLDHVKFLGNTIQEIALNKSFLMKNGVSNVVLSSQAIETEIILTNIAKKLKIENIMCYKKDYEVFRDEKNNSPVYESSLFDVCFPFKEPNMTGDYQLINAGCAITACLACKKSKNINITINSINTGIKNTLNIVRMQNINKGFLFSQLPQKSIFYVDGAHNQLAAHALASWIKNFKQKHKNSYKICLAVARTKNADNKAFLQEFLDKNQKPIVDLLISTRANLESIPEPPEKIAETAKKLNFCCKTAYNITEVINYAKDSTQKVLLICTGSLYIARDILAENRFN